VSNVALLDQRRAGILLHPTSLPGPFVGGDIGHAAYRFIDFLADSGCSVWQMLPLGPAHLDGSPYQCLSVHAGNPLLISLDWLVDKGWLDFSNVHEPRDFSSFRTKCLNSAYHSFVEENNAEWNKKLKVFAEQQAAWLDDYALFIVIKQQQNGNPWNEWPEPFVQQDAAAMHGAQIQYADHIAQIEFEQFIFFTQWHELREYAHSKDVYLFGDMPIYASYDSADVWACRENFLLDQNGNAEFVAGVPPDAFSEQGQRWGNSLYDWNYMQSSNFEWWTQRFATQLELFDLIRIDHFRGLEACWQIPADEETAINGKWVRSPGRELLQVLNKNFKSLPLIAEDLGLITEEVIKLRKEFSLPGMKILQFAFNGDRKNPYLPYNHERECVVYTGTHDNNTTLGWYQQLGKQEKCYLHDYLGAQESDTLDMPWVMNRMALASVANLAILPMQDILSLDASHCMNVPGTTEGNWLWRFDWEQLWPGLSSDLKKLIEIYGRIPD
jgi:4-alpha-glucanotransferase